jgi:hypothetical protein
MPLKTLKELQEEIAKLKDDKEADAYVASLRELMSENPSLPLEI